MIANRVHVSAQSAVLMDEATGRVLFGKDIHKKMRIASITKVMTAILAIESGKLNKTVTISDNAYGTEGSSLYLKRGEKVKLKDLVYGLLMRSGNDAAIAIAEAVSGSTGGFVYQMNKKAKELGMLDTTFANPHGLDDERHRSTAYDMALLTKYAMQNKTFQKMFKTKFYNTPQEGEKWDRHWKNKNKLLFNYDYSTGGKTGYTKKTGRTLISTATKDDKDFIVVTLNDGDDWNDHRTLFNWGFNHFNMVKVMHEGKLNGVKKTYYKGAVFLHRDIVLPLTTEEKKHLTTQLMLYKPKQGQEFQKPPKIAGRLKVSVEGETLADVPVFYKQAEKEKKGFWSLVQVIIGHMLEPDHD
ncbi:D-alanyl-D-alanine carboxypeptidase DacB [Pullulanibacillus camelliae]|uniref:serine-type D-Ala-D-Ala carboxypeptidase n=2 Tax=Pullulanibacillus camelliae TaxID=1707096 RepID=A0A8J2VMG7_9BACL|nr:D-alanyl-D-alanine carboxypeptidase DacB [Pullulanibacillus camelliae]